ncbi:hypothetical protein [Maricaulis sp. CAU 1757]
MTPSLSRLAFLLCPLALQACGNDSPAPDDEVATQALASAQPAPAVTPLPATESADQIPGPAVAPARWQEIDAGRLGFGRAGSPPDLMLGCATEDAEIIITIAGPLPDGDAARGTLVTPSGSATGFFHASDMDAGMISMRLPANHPALRQVANGTRFAFDLPDRDPILLPPDPRLGQLLETCQR